MPHGEYIERYWIVRIRDWIMKKIHLISAKKLLRKISLHGLSNKEFIVYFIYLVILLFLYHFLPSYLDEGQRTIRSAGNLSVLLKIFLVVGISGVIFERYLKEIYGHISKPILLFMPMVFSCMRF